MGPTITVREVVLHHSSAVSATHILDKNGGNCRRGVQEARQPTSLTPVRKIVVSAPGSSISGGINRAILLRACDCEPVSACAVIIEAKAEAYKIDCSLSIQTSGRPVTPPGVKVCVSD